MRARRLTPWPMAVLAAVLVTSSAAGQSSLAGETIHIRRTFGAITIDGDLSDEGWRDATRVEKWYEVNPGDNTEPAVKSLAFLTYDDRFFYVAFQFDDPDPTKIRGPLADHDGINGQADDMAGLFLDTLNTGRTAILFLVNPETFSTTQSSMTRRGRTSRRTISGTRQRRSAIADGTLRSESRSRRFGIRTSIRRHGGAFCTGIIRAGFVIRLRPRSSRAAGTALSVARIR
jgi:hypothetical protein